MAQPIQLSFRGDGRVVRLTPQTVHAAFHEFVRVNGLTYSQLRPFETIDRQPCQWGHTTLDRLFRRADRGPLLTARQIAGVERVMNRMLLRSQLALTEGEGRIVPGMLHARTPGLHWRSGFALIRHALLLSLQSLTRANLMRGGPRDVVVESVDRSVAVARFLGVQVDHRNGGLALRFADRFQLQQRWTVPQSRFDCIRLFGVLRVSACDGYRLDGLATLATGLHDKVSRDR